LEEKFDEASAPFLKADFLVKQIIFGAINSWIERLLHTQEGMAHAWRFPI
jgi:hypothetical protein